MIQAFIKPLVQKMIKDIKKKEVQKVAFEFTILEEENDFEITRVFYVRNGEQGAKTLEEFQQWIKEE